jgi:hypothetical protein
MDLIHTEQHRIFRERTGLPSVVPEAVIEFSRPIGYGELLQVVQAHAYELSATRGTLLSMPEATADWYATSFVPAVETIHSTGFARRFDYKTDGDLYLWVNRKLNELRTRNSDATWADAVEAASHEAIPRNHRESTLRQRRTPLPSS